MTQLTLRDAVAAEVLKEAGQAVVEEHSGGFVALMREKAITISDEKGFVSSDELRTAAEAMGLVPHHPNVWGALFHGTHWRIVGRQKSKLPGNHAREIKIWEYVR